MCSKISKKKKKNRTKNKIRDENRRKKSLELITGRNELAHAALLQLTLGERVQMSCPL